ncbi:MAG TPA: amidohydrolase family protein [Solirubrobacteraceae bacterium]|nr:amidohydrolase family protein [Solirubrobacteraceae bacterium]
MAVLSLRGALDEVRHVDHHAHALLREPPHDLNAFRGLFSESPDPAQWPHVATAITYLRAIELLGSHLGCEPDERAVFELRRRSDPGEYASRLLRGSGATSILIDTGFPQPEDALTVAQMGALAGCPAHRVLRIESLSDSELSGRIAGARGDGFVALKTIVAYRGGLDPETGDPATHDRLNRALEVNRDTGEPLPVQVHTGFGDPDLLLARADPSLLKPLIERFAQTPFVLLHCYPFIREAGWLASVYPNVFFDLSLTIPHVARPNAVVAEALELAPLSKLLYASDAVRTPELYLLASIWWRDALAEALGSWLPQKAAIEGARRVLCDNATELYRL